MGTPPIVPRFKWTKSSSVHVVVLNGQSPFYLDILEWAIEEGRNRVSSEIDEEALRQVCVDEVRRWFEQAVSEVVVALRPLEYAAAWGPKAMEVALSDEALTAAIVSHRWHMLTAIKRGLAGRLGRVRESSSSIALAATPV